MTGRRFFLTVAGLLAASTSCLPAGLKAKAPDLYAIDPGVPRHAPSAGEAPIPIALPATRAVAALESRGMVYVQREHEIRYFARSEWVDSPPRMLAPLLARALEANGEFHVVNGAAGEPARLRLDTELVLLQQEFTAKPSHVRLVLRAQLSDAAARRTLGEQEIEIVEAAPSEDPYGGVVAANAAAARAVSQVAAACATWARDLGPASAQRSPP